jgi:prolyl oligopeptidase PreP (S9A serine peptidase family)
VAVIGLGILVRTLKTGKRKSVKDLIAVVQELVQTNLSSQRTQR